VKRKQRSPLGWDRLPPTLGLIFVVLLATWMAGAQGGYLVSHWAPPVLILASLTLFVSVVGFSAAARVGLSAKLALGLFGAYGAWTFASILWSPNKGDAWFGAGQTLLYGLSFWITVYFVALGASRLWVLIASVLGPAAVAAFILVALGIRPEGVLDADGRLVGSIGYYSGEAAFLLVPFWLAVYLGGSRGVPPILRGAALAGAVLCVEAAVLTQSRGTMVAIAASLPVFFLLSGQRVRALVAFAPIAAALFVAFPGLNGIYSLEEGAPVEELLALVLQTAWLTGAGAGLYGLCWGLIDRRWEPPSVAVRAVGGLAFVCCLLILAASAMILIERVGDPVAAAQQKWEAFRNDDTTGQEQSRYLSASATGRYTYWTVAWEDFATHPFLGVGTHNYEATYYRLREQNSGPVRQPHSLPLEILAERGIVGGALFFGLLVACIVAGLQKRFGNLSSDGKAQVGALIAAVTYWFVYSSAEWFWQIPAVTLPAIIYLALLVSPLREVELAPESRRRLLFRLPMRAVGVGVAVLAMAVIAPLYIADQYLKRSQAATDPVQGLETVERAQRFNPLNATLPEREAELAIGIGDWDRAEDAYTRAVQLDPEHYVPYMLLATFYERREESEKALLYYHEALALDPLGEDLELHAEWLNLERQPRVSNLVARSPSGFATALNCQHGDPKDRPAGPC
jgi:hypothetical protein